MAKVIIVGYDDPYDQTPLQPDIPGSSGARLWRMTGLPMIQYAKSFKRYNIFGKDDRRDVFTGMGNARRILGEIDTRYVNTYVICLGRQVAQAFKLPPDVRPFIFSKIWKNTRAAYMPHTSGLNRWYNDVDNLEAATVFMRQLGAVASGEIEDLADMRAANTY